MTLKELITVYGGDEAIQEDFSMLSDDEFLFFNTNSIFTP